MDACSGRASGSRCSAATSALSNERWLDDEWAATIRYQRHLLQLHYVDTVVGALVSQLRDAGLYDDALIVITADHGTSLRSGFPFLQATEASFVDIAAVPLFFKSPGQRQGETVDTNVETIDILPPLAAALGVRLPCHRWRERARPGLERPSREDATGGRRDPPHGRTGRSARCGDGARTPQAGALRRGRSAERADGTVALAEAYAGDGEPRVLNLILDATVALLGATAAGFHGLEHTEARAFRWTTGEARINVPIDPEAPPAALAVDVVMTGQPKWFRIEADGCVLFDDTISSRWAESFILDSCRLTPPSLEILLASDTHVPDTSDNRTLGVGVAAVELCDR